MYDILGPYNDLVQRALEDYRAQPIPMLRCNLRAALETRRYAKRYETLRATTSEERIRFMAGFEFKWNKHFERYYAWRVADGHYDL